MEEGEVWKPVIGFEGYLEVSSLGRVQSVGRYFTRKYINCIGNEVISTQYKEGVVLKQNLNRSGYYLVKVQVKGKSYSLPIHKEVCKAFHGVEKDKVVDHKDEDKTNNCKDNLRWLSRKDNATKESNKFGKKASAFTGTVVAIDIVTGEEICEMQGNKDMKKRGFDYRNVSAVLQGKRRSHKGCYFVKKNDKLQFSEIKNVVLSKTNFKPIKVFDFDENYLYTITSWDEIYNSGFTPIKVLQVLKGSDRTHKNHIFKI